MNTLLDYDFVRKLKALSFVDAVYLYGSRARGDNNERSDIDIAVECPTATDEDWLVVLDIVDNADTLLKIDCVRYDKIDNTKLLNEIRQYHILL